MNNVAYNNHEVYASFS